MAQIHILCPPVRTGGPEALHQLSHSLLTLGMDARMVYLDRTELGRGSLVALDYDPLGYDLYTHLLTTQILPDAGGLLVVPEGLISPRILEVCRNCHTALWWLSVDNALPALATMGGLDRLRALPLRHLCQSTYAECFLALNGFLEQFRLFDYTSPPFLEPTPGVPRRDRVLFNPLKAGVFTQLLQESAPDIRWIPVTNMTPQEVRRLMVTSKVYIDFGHHPGKDRIPREAAISGCCVLTSLAGSARFYGDVPIPPRYKFISEPGSLPAILELVRSCLRDFDEHSAAFAPYRSIIQQEREEFHGQVADLFPRLLQESPRLSF